MAGSSNKLYKAYLSLKRKKEKKKTNCFFDGCGFCFESFGYSDILVHHKMHLSTAQNRSFKMIQSKPSLDIFP